MTGFEQLAGIRADIRARLDGTPHVLVVTDGAGERAPVSAVDRDPVLGGLGLQLTAMLASAYGWVSADSCTHVRVLPPDQPGDQPPDA